MLSPESAEILIGSLNKYQGEDKQQGGYSGSGQDEITGQAKFFIPKKEQTGHNGKYGC
jgi:hypothetical protein